MRCEVCHAQVEELRRGRCWGCYGKWAESRPVGLGASCITCGERRREFLKQMELLGSWLPACFNCSGRIARLPALPMSLRELKAELERDRRLEERRLGKSDTRVFPRERRGFDRRFGRDEEFVTASEDQHLAELLDELSGSDRGDLTCIKMLDDIAEAG